MPALEWMAACRSNKLKKAIAHCTVRFPTRKVVADKQGSFICWKRPFPCPPCPRLGRHPHRTCTSCYQTLWRVAAIP